MQPETGIDVQEPRSKVYFGPFRNKGDFRLWIMASLIWVILASIQQFYIEPLKPVEEQLKEWEARCVETYPGITLGNELPPPEYYKQRANACSTTAATRQSAENSHDKEIASRLFWIILLPPVGFVFVLWGLIETIKWIKSGYME